MKGGKGGQGRNRLPAKPVTKPKPHDGPKRGAPKRDWGAVDRDDPMPDTPPPAPKRRPSA